VFTPIAPQRKLGQGVGLSALLVVISTPCAIVAEKLSTGFLEEMV
jgi:hypothetical protein